MGVNIVLLTTSILICVVQSMPTNGTTATSNSTFISCTTNICENGGSCFQDIANMNNVFCRCTDDYYGDKCDKEAEPIYKDVLYGMILFSALLLIAAVYFSCQFYVRKTDLNDAKREKMELEQHYQRQLNTRYKQNHNNLSRQNSAKSDISSISPHFYEVTPDGKLVKTGDQEKNHLKLEQVRFSSIRKEKDLESSDYDSDMEQTDKPVTAESTESINLKSTKPEHNSLGLLEVKDSKERPKSWAGSDQMINEKTLTRSLSTKSDTKSISSTTSKTSAVSQRGLTPEMVRKHHAKSLQDLRELAMNDVAAPNPAKKDQYVLNMHTGQITKARSRDTIIQKAINSSHQKHKGIWAHSQERQRDR